MNHIIIRENSSEIRTIARNALSDNWVKVATGLFLFYVLTITIPAMISGLIPNATMVYYLEELQRNYSISYVPTLYSGVLTGAFDLGLCSFLLAFFRKKDIHPGYIFNGFEHFLKSFALLFMQTLLICLWTLLFVVPGIIAAFRYSQAFFILADHPEKGVMQCITESKEMMVENKGKYFSLLISFIGWIILASVPSYFTPFVLQSGFLGAVIDLILSIPYIFVLAYMGTARCIFYDLASGNLMARKKTVEENDQFKPRYIEDNPNKNREEQ